MIAIDTPTSPDVFYRLSAVRRARAPPVPNCGYANDTNRFRHLVEQNHRVKVSPGSDRLLGQISNTVHGVDYSQPMPVNRSRLRQVVGDLDHACAGPGFALSNGPGTIIVIRPYQLFSVRRPSSSSVMTRDPALAELVLGNILGQPPAPATDQPMTASTLPHGLQHLWRLSKCRFMTRSAPVWHRSRAWVDDLDCAELIGRIQIHGYAGYRARYADDISQASPRGLHSSM